ncbi:hypothetical protein HPB47_002406 [Ixodes persulcatus]|uniref:Uncharacterized protein n=1 Tax=Ixodes persulcatus TaxID=34615 RepID=A0AC60PLN1_IXOPE|nr:hypothetical protein HPB47_002406 [Ixodes persulcatus]
MESRTGLSACAAYVPRARVNLPLRFRLLFGGSVSSVFIALHCLRYERTPKGNLRKPSRQDVHNFVSNAWAAVPEDVIRQSFKGCGISTALDGSEDGELHQRLACVRPPSVPHDRGALADECVDLMFCSDSEESFDGFPDED